MTDRRTRGARWSVTRVRRRLREMADPRHAAGAARLGIQGGGIWGIPVPRLRAFAREIGKNHQLALRLWRTGLHDARLLAVMIDDPALVTERQMEEWVRDFDSWDICDGACWNFFDRTPLAWRKAVEWSRRREEFVRRGGYVLMAGLALHDKEASDARLRAFLPYITRGASDERPMVKKAVSWALREIGKRNRALNRAATTVARALRQSEHASARWIGGDALRDMANPAAQRRLPR